MNIMALSNTAKPITRRSDEIENKVRVHRDREFLEQKNKKIKQ